VALPVTPPVKPMLAKARPTLPTDDGLLYEPKWDGFRCIVFRDGDAIDLQSRNLKPFNRYFPEILGPLLDALPRRCVVDGELVVPTSAGLDFEALQQRIHPAESRVRMLAEATPVSYIAFDLIALDDTDLRPVELRRRRELLEAALAGAEPPVHLSIATTDAAQATDWFERFEGAGLDGVVAKPLDGTYREDERVLVKVKPERTADCVAAGFRWHKHDGIGSILLGLYTPDGRLHHAGVASSFSAALRAELVGVLEPLTEGALAEHPWSEWADPEAHRDGLMPGTPSRWNAERNLEWTPIRLERVVEVRYTQLQSGRFRPNARFHRWRPDRDPDSCTYDQLEVPPPRELHEIFG
jgi:ATP-dependent DNA ligase